MLTRYRGDAQLSGARLGRCRLPRLLLGAAEDQCALGDSTTVWLYKLCRAAVAARPGRREIIIDRDNFPTDRYIVQGIAAECGLELRWIEPDSEAGVTADGLAEALSEQTAMVLLSHVAYRSGYVAQMAELTELTHQYGALILWDLCHSVGVLPVELDACQVDLAVGCTYKYLNGGPGAPAFGYVRAELQDSLQQPIQGWLGNVEPFRMGPEYRPAAGIRGFTSGTPTILGMLAMQDMIELIKRAGIDAVRAGSIDLTEYAIARSEELLGGAGVRLASPRDPARRGGHITLDHPRFRDVYRRLWDQGIIPDFREPEGIRLGLSPLSTSFTEVDEGITAIQRELAKF